MSSQPDQTRYYTLDGNLMPQPCTKAEWLVWATLDVAEMAYTHIGTEGVQTRFPGFAGPAQRLFRTRVFGMVCAGMHDGADTYEEAMAVHARMCARVRAEMAERWALRD